MPKWSKTKEIKFSGNELAAILRKVKYNYKSWDEVPSFNIGQKTIEELRDFEKEEEIEFGYDEKANRICIYYLSDYQNKIALK